MCTYRSAYRYHPHRAPLVSVWEGMYDTCSLIISAAGRRRAFLRGSLRRPFVHLSVFPYICKHFLVIASSPRPLGGFVFKLGQNVPFNIKLCKYRKKFRSVDKHVYRQTDRQTNGRTPDRSTSVKLLWSTSRRAKNEYGSK